MKYIITIDQRTSSTKALLFDSNLNLLDRKAVSHKLISLKEGWVETDAEEIYRNVVEAVRQLEFPTPMAEAEISVSIVTQRETALIWDKNTGKPVHRAVSWQCQRGAQFCRKLIDDGLETLVKERTGLMIDPYFSASGIKWILDNVESVRERAERGDLLFGTIDTWLIWKLTKGKVHKTDYTNASRTLLFNIRELDWDPDMLKIFTVPSCMLPDAVPSDSIFGETDIEGILPAPAVIAGVIGNSHGALVGQKCFEPGMGKVTYGTGSSVMFNIGTEPVQAPNGMVCSVGFSLFDTTYYSIEGHVHTSGGLLAWLRDSLQLVNADDDLDAIASSVPDNGGVYLVPAFSGLGSPWWVPEAKAMITGMTLSTTKAHVVRAALESMAYQVADIVDLISRNLTQLTKVLCVDGDSAVHEFLVQFQADILGFPVRRLGIVEASGYGSAILNCCARGEFTSAEQLKQLADRNYTCNPVMKPEERVACQQGWLNSVHTLILGSKKHGMQKKD